jgi:hypothetical protein
VATERVSLDEIMTGWLKLTVEWSPILGGNLVDEVYIWTEASVEWTEDEKRILWEHYATALQDQLMQQLPTRSWGAIARMGGTLPVVRSQAPTKRFNLPSVNDRKIMQENELPLEEMLRKRVYWKEYVSLPQRDNNEARSTY